MRVNGGSVRTVAALLLVGAVTLTACTSSESTSEGDPDSTTSVTSAESSAPALPPESDNVDLRVMSFNIEYGGVGVDFGSVSKAINAAHADVVAINEGYGNIPRLAAALGWSYFDIRSQIVSRLPLLTPPGNDDYLLHRDARTTDGRAVFVEVEPGKVAALVNVHLPSSPYAPFKVQQGASARQVLALEKRVRVPALGLPLETAQKLIADDIPVFLLGDFNSPSDLDWTKATVGLRDQVKYPLRWPASAAVEAAGLVDSYRAVHPDPAADQGLTWPASRPFVKGYNPGPAGQAADRIDLLFSGGPARATESTVVGERGSGGHNIVVTPWPSDHRAVVTQFDVTPAPTPTLVSARTRLVHRGDRLTVDYSAADDDAVSLVIKAAVGREDALVTDSLTNPAQGTEHVDTARLKPGGYEAVLLGGDSAPLAQMAFWVEAPGAKPVLQTGRSSYARGDPVDISWQDAPGNRNDWLGVFREGGVPGVDSYLGWTYVGSEITGSTLIDAKINGISWPLPKGRYTTYLLKDDGYGVLARADFTVR